MIITTGVMVWAFMGGHYWVAGILLLQLLIMVHTMAKNIEKLKRRRF